MQRAADHAQDNLFCDWACWPIVQRVPNECDGRILFSIKYLWWLCRYGYWNNPYEVEARAAELKSP